MKKSFIYLLALLLVLTSCYNDNDYILNQGKSIHSQYSNRLEELLPLFDSTYQDPCNVFHINMSTTTDLFVQEGTIDHLYDSTLFKEMSIDQEKFIRDKKPRKELNDIWYLKDVFLAFSISEANHKSLDRSYMIRVLDSAKFNSVYKKFVHIYNNDKLNNTISNWIYHIDDKWWICTGDLVHDGSDKVCKMLKDN
jgi:hypothetical protein